VGRPRLVAALRAAIRAHGPLTVAAYLEQALYHPTLGYYSVLRAPPGARGDFYTSPEVHAAFGALLARQAREVWERLERPTPFVVEEWGGGSGRLAHDFLAAAHAEAPAFAAAVRYRLVERSAALRRWQQRQLRPWGAQVEWVGPEPAAGGPAPLPSALEGLLLANELLDAFPVHRVVWRQGVLYERYVTVADAGFAEIDGPPSTPALAAYFARLGLRPPDDHLAEVNLAAVAWLQAQAARLRRGALLLIDYGHPAEVLYSARYPRGTLRAYSQHALSENPYVRVGCQDLTSQVDLTSVLLAGRAAGLTPLGIARQADFLRRLGLEAWRETLCGGRLPVVVARGALAALDMLTSPSGLGRLWVVGFGRALGPQPLHGLDERAVPLALPPPIGPERPRLGWDRWPPWGRPPGAG
jgi:SAM-dependent MidA family methyltransferase